jgi:peptidoglycan/xylan/chitin deacetylase (PgdA/CDA1 family)/spore germination protein YaaH
VVIALAVLVSALAVLHAKNPNLPNVDPGARIGRAVPDPANKLSMSSPENKKYRGFKAFLLKKQQQDAIKARFVPVHSDSLIRAAFYTPWNKTALPDLERNAGKLNTIFPEWFFIDTTDFSLQTRIDLAALQVMKKNNLSIQPVLTNYHSSSTAAGKGFFDSKLLHVILTDSLKRRRLLSAIADTLRFYQLQGLNVDLEEPAERSNNSMTRFQKELYEILHPAGFLLSMDVQAMNEDYDLEALANYNDHFVLMAYDQFSEVNGPGPISSQKWIESQLDWMDDKVDASKIILGVAGYGRDWQNGEEGKTVEDLTYAEAVDKAKLSGATISFDNNSYNLHFRYNEPATDSSSETNHAIWLTDAVTSFNILRFSDDYRTAGTALWHLGGEDPRIWNFYGRDLSSAALKANPFEFASLERIPPDANAKPTATGEGELLSVLYTPAAGIIKLEVDSTEMLIAEQQYVQLSSGYVYEKFAEDKTPIGPGHKIILTFDDGPAAPYTPKILDILEKEKIPATFFVIGLNAESNIPLLERIYRDGYEIGNHSFTHHNMAVMSPERAELEMKTTRTLIECITGHSTILFRAPYNADSEPQTFEEIEPIARSKRENYITVGESIDPNDWDPGANADSIVARTIRIAEQTNASIILLHDAGGQSRQATVDALPRIITYFKNRGCKFTTVADLMGKKKEELMPAVKQSWQTKLNFLVAEASFRGGQLLYILFIAGIVLSMGRMLSWRAWQ